MKFSSPPPNFHRDRCPKSTGCLPPLLFSFLLATLISIFFIVHLPNPLNSIQKRTLDQPKLVVSNKPPANKPRKGIDDIDEIRNCDLSKGRWVPDAAGPAYTNSSCKTIPQSKNCFMHGRKDSDFLNWRWKPDQCELPRFDARRFLAFVRGKKLAFVGDSVSRNHMESLLCLLSQVETPEDEYKDSDDRNRIWYFPSHDFTLFTLWTKFLVVGEERVVNGSSSGTWDLYLDRIDQEWTKDLRNVDYVIISDAHWFFRPLYLHNGTNVVGCVYCNEPGVMQLDVPSSLKMAFRAAFKHINSCKNCKVKVTLLRTFSPAHFEDGAWNSAGRCNRTSPFREQEISTFKSEWEMRKMQVEEIEVARREGERKGRRYGMIDVTRAMLMRPDGHPGQFWGNKWMKGYNDCVHWCLPGPIDLWNDFLMAVLKREAAFVFRRAAGL